MKYFFHKFLTTRKGHFDFKFKNNARAFLEFVDFKKCQS